MTGAPTGRHAEDMVKLLRQLSDSHRRQTELIEWALLSQLAQGHTSPAVELTQRIKVLELRLWPKGRL